MENSSLKNSHAFSLAVHLHLYYCDMWEEVKHYLVNIGDYPYHLYVTLTYNDCDIIQKIKEFHRETDIFIIQNRGYDVGPFIYFLQQIDLNSYDLILKIHTKNYLSGPDTFINHQYISRHKWFLLLFGGLLNSKKLFAKNMEKFFQNKKLGMVASKYLITSDVVNSRVVSKNVKKIMKNLGFINFNKTLFVAGTMFMVRSKLLQKIKDNFNFDDFDLTDATVKEGTLAHTLERVFGCVVIAQGYQIKGFDVNHAFECQNSLLSICNFFYRRKITKRNYDLIKICKIPVYHRKLA